MLENLRVWYQSTRKKVTYFMVALVVAYLLSAISIGAELPKPFLLFSLCMTLVIPFSLFVMLATDNPIFERLQSKKWIVVTITLLITIYGSLSFIWASSEVNSIFEVSAGNLPWSVSILTVIYFFKNIILFGSLSAFVLVFLYVNIWVVRVFVTNYRGIWGFIVDLVGGLFFVIGIGLLMGSAGALIFHKAEFSKIVAINADFSAHHRCTGNEFTNSKGVLFLPTGNVLVSRVVSSQNFGITYSFKEVPCTK
jgi:hypothetical protein